MAFRFTAQDEATLEAKYGPATPKPVKITLVPAPASFLRAGEKLMSERAAKQSQGPCQSIWIPRWQPALLNKLMQGHWGNSARQKKADKQIVAFYFAQSGIPKATGPRRLSMMFVLAKGKRLFDRDAPWKSTKDALAACGALLDDTPALCVDGSVSYARALLECQSGTLLMLEDL